MRALIPTVLVLLASALLALVVIGQGGARSAESVACSSTLPPSRLDLSGRKWTDGKYSYVLKQKGSCLWWAGGRSRNGVFFGSVFSSSVTGVWADVVTGASGTLTLSVSTSGNSLFLRSSTGGFPAKKRLFLSRT